MFFYPALLCIFFAITTVNATVNITDVILSLPECSVGTAFLQNHEVEAKLIQIQCILTNPKVVSDPHGTCTNESIQASVSACVQKSCVPLDQARVVIANGKLCEGVPVNNTRVVDAYIAGFVCVLPALLAIALRLYSRHKIAREFGYDDYLMCIVAVFLVVLLVLDVYNAGTNGFGRHLWAIDPERIEELLKILWVVEIFYTASVTVIKSSIVMFYLRIFPGRYTRAASFTTLALVVSSGIAIILATVFQCKPVSGAWHFFSPSQCVNLNLLIYASGYIGIGLDVLILIIPIPAALKLKMELKKKLLVMCMFSVGVFAFIISIVRLRFIVSFGSSTDPTWDNVLPAIWSLAEVTVATICACMPAVRALLALIFPKLFDTLSRPSQPSHPTPFKDTPFPSGSAHRFIPTPSSERPDIVYGKHDVASPEDISLRNIEAASDTKDKTSWTSSQLTQSGGTMDTKRTSQNSTCASVHASSETNIITLGDSSLSDRQTVDEGADAGIERKRKTRSLGFDFNWK
ncbi:hypothetical protein GLAREA_01794 [Glarea lozoyensis ATCC 20868]|uniref:Rhodopsin domain-containing protein n=1 Tax=Glarea lozoyensis (strain ATCC 20868 / MF5171) TaxID=1116229 RepID=S3CHE4_GLAL2|nr:uncharacterized protein GLAREA_01794 [Glarea lozoyensis ATCC 20868]EPE25882.1 hypothetical protein GLAREA_01794 [Glarea lozoyensis ATCC 20868]